MNDNLPPIEDEAGVNPDFALSPMDPNYKGVAEYAIGIPGKKPRFFVTSSRADALLQLRPGEVCFSQVNYPYECKINDEGTALIADPIPVEKIIAKGWIDVKMRREELLNIYRWAWMPDSPLTDDNQAEWLAWAKKLHRVTIEYALPQDVVWPVMPELKYPDDSVPVV